MKLVKNGHVCLCGRMVNLFFKKQTIWFSLVLVRQVSPELLNRSPSLNCLYWRGIGDDGWLVVWTPLKNISQLGCSKPPTRWVSSQLDSFQRISDAFWRPHRIVFVLTWRPERNERNVPSTHRISSELWRQKLHSWDGDPRLLHCVSGETCACCCGENSPFLRTTFPLLVA